MESPIIWITLACSVVGLITYLITRICYSDRVHAANVRAAKEEAGREAADEFFSRLHLEQEIENRTEGSFLWKKNYLVIHERLRYQDLPITGWVEHERLLDKQFDGDGLKQVAQTASLLLGPGKVAGISTKILSGISKAARNSRNYHR